MTMDCSASRPQTDFAVSGKGSPRPTDTCRPRLLGEQERVGLRIPALAQVPIRLPLRRTQAYRPKRGRSEGYSGELLGVEGARSWWPAVQSAGMADCDGVAPAGEESHDGCGRVGTSPQLGAST